MLRLHYLYPGETIVDTGMTTNNQHVDSWAQVNAEMNPDVIFFFTVDSTDIF